MGVLCSKIMLEYAPAPSPFASFAYIPLAYIPPAVILVVLTVKALAELCLLLIVGRALVGLLVGLLAGLFGGLPRKAARESNPVHRLFDFLLSPITRLTRLITPKLILDRHIALVAFLLLAWIWMGSVVAKKVLCSERQDLSACVARDKRVR